MLATRVGSGGATGCVRVADTKGQLTDECGVVSFDKPSGRSSDGGENRPDRGGERGDRPEERPRPGGSRDRPEPTPVPHVPTADEIRARRAGLADSRDYERLRATQRDGEAQDDTQRRDGPGDRGDDAGPDDPAESSRFVREPLDRSERIPAAHVPTADEVRARRAGHTETSAPDPAETPRQEADAQKAEDTKPRTPQDTERSGAKADAPRDSEPEQRTADDESTASNDTDTPVPSPKDRPSTPPEATDVRPEEPDETGPEASPDQQADEQRWAALEQRVAARVEATIDQRVTEALEDIKTEVRAEVAADYKATIEKQQARIDELEARQEAPEGQQNPAREGTQATDDQPARAEKKPDILKTGDRQDKVDAAVDADVAAATQRERSQLQRAEQASPEIHERRWFTLKNATAVGSTVSFGSTIAALFSHMPPELALGPAAISFATGVWGSTIVEHIRKKRRDQS